MSINVDDLTIGQVREISKMVGGGCSTTPRTYLPVELEDRVLIRTITYHILGDVVDTCGSWVRLSPAIWVASSGRWANALKTGELDEVEVTDQPGWVNLETAVDIYEWRHDLPTETK